jgi:hypothetical protein
MPVAPRIPTGIEAITLKSKKKADAVETVSAGERSME